MIRFFYGDANNYKEVTRAVFDACFDGDRIYIPAGDGLRADILTDPQWGVLKNVIVFREEAGTLTCRLYRDTEEISLQLSELEIRSHGNRPKASPIPSAPVGSDTDEKINFYHSQLNFAAGKISDELAEQAMIVEFVRPDARVLELGSNIGRSTLMLSCVLDDESNLVTLECDPVSVELLRNNRYANNLRFHIEPSALSYRKLIQQSWMTIPSETLLPGYQWVNTITFEELIDKYALEFDTLVADCEGALYYILRDNDKILRNIQTVVLESDYAYAEHKFNVEEIFADYGLNKVYSKSLAGAPGWPAGLPDECWNSFYEVWQRASVS